MNVRLLLKGKRSWDNAIFHVLNKLQIDKNRTVSDKEQEACPGGNESMATWQLHR